MKDQRSKPLFMIQCYEDRQPTLPLRKPEVVTNGNSNHAPNMNGKHIPTSNGNHVPNNNGSTNGYVAPQTKPQTNGNHVNKQNGQTTHTDSNLAPQANGFHAPHTNGNHVPKKESPKSAPPPPPPMPVTNGQHNDEYKTDDRQKSIKEISLELLNNSKSRNDTLSRTPTPDYNDKVPALTQVKLNGKEDKAELESLESYKLKSPLNAAPKPPSNYFVSPPNGTATMKKHLRPISVTIGEYACGGGNRKEPSKLEFLGADKADGTRNGRNDESITNRLQSELALTLSRSNLRKKTDVTGDTGR